MLLKTTILLFMWSAVALAFDVVQITHDQFESVYQVERQVPKNINIESPKINLNNEPVVLSLGLAQSPKNIDLLVNNTWIKRVVGIDPVTIDISNYLNEGLNDIYIIDTNQVSSIGKNDGIVSFEIRLAVDGQAAKGSAVSLGSVPDKLSAFTRSVAIMKMASAKPENMHAMTSRSR